MVIFYQQTALWRHDWIGPELGFPIYKEGDFFRDNLFRAGI